MTLTRLYAAPAADTYLFIDDPGICARLFIHVQGTHRANLEAGGIRALIA